MLAAVAPSVSPFLSCRHHFLPASACCLVWSDGRLATLLHCSYILHELRTLLCVPAWGGPVCFQWGLIVPLQPGSCFNFYYGNALCNNITFFFLLLKPTLAIMDHGCYKWNKGWQRVGYPPTIIPESWSFTHTHEDYQVRFHTWAHTRRVPVGSIHKSTNSTYILLMI